MYLWYASEMPKQRKDEPVDWREGRRMRAWELHQHGWKQQDIASALGVTQGAVSQWVKRGNNGGVPALRRRPASGSAPRLSIRQREQLRIALARGDSAIGFAQWAPGDVWTTKRIAAVIKDCFGVSYHPAHVSRIVRARAKFPVAPNASRPTRRMLPSRRGTPSVGRTQKRPRSKGAPSFG